MFYRSTASYELVTWPKDTFHRRGDVSAECRRTSWIFMGQIGKVYSWWREQYLLNLLAMFGELWGIECVCVLEREGEKFDFVGRQGLCHRSRVGWSTKEQNQGKHIKVRAAVRGGKVKFGLVWFCFFLSLLLHLF